MAFQNRKREKVEILKVKPISRACHNCGAKPVYRYHFGGLRLCRTCADKTDSGELKFDDIKRDRKAVK